MYLLFIPGLPRSFSTSLYRIIQKVDLYGSIPGVKECPYLHKLFFPKDYKTIKYCADLKRFPNKDKNITIENYFLGLDKIRKSNHIGVSDHSCYNIVLTQENLELVKNSSPYKFRTILLFRDPIKHACSIYHHNRGKNFFEEYKKGYTKGIRLSFTYVSIYNKFKNVFGNDMLHFVSEELFTSKSQQNLLEDFLSIPKNSLDFNVHVNQSNLKLSIEEYNSIFSEVKPVYDQWESKFGSLPSCWGKL